MLSFVGGYMQIVQQIYLSLLGFSTVSIGLLISVTLVTDALRMVAYGTLADRYGRRNILAVMYLTNIAYFVIYYFSREFTWFLVAAMIAGGGFTGVGFGGPVEQALLAEKSNNQNRTLAFSLQTFSTSALSILGNFLSGMPEYLQVAYRMDVIESIKPLFLLGILFSLGAAATILLITEDKRGKAQVGVKRPYLPKEMRGLVLKFSISSIIMGMGGGIFLQLAPTWFYQTYKIKISEVGYILGASKVIETSAYLFAPVIAVKTGLVKAYLLTRLGGASIMVVLPFMPNALSAAFLFSLRTAVLHSSLPLKSSYMMALLSPEERASAASLVNLFGSMPRSASTTVGGYLMESVSTSLPVHIAATMFFAEAFYYYFTFRNIKPPEEKEKEKTGEDAPHH